MVTFVDFFGAGPSVKVVDFFLRRPDELFSKSAIARLVGVSRSTLLKVCPSLVSVSFLRQEGIKFKLNRFNGFVVFLNDFWKDFNGGGNI